jgi:hypothetical protein
VLTLGSYVSAAYQSRPDETVQRFYSALLDWAGVERPVDVDAPGIEVRTLEREMERIFFVFNHSAERRDVGVQIRMPGTDGRRGVDVVSRAEIGLERDGDRARVRLSVEPHDVRVVHVF